jgi:hypothetical protein
LKDFKDFEEFIAVLVTNIYASANGKKALRASYRDHGVLDRHFDSSFEFFQISGLAFPLISNFRDANKEFCKRLAKVKAPFNPIRAFFADADKVRKLSEGTGAATRDAQGLWDMFW